MSPSLSPRSSLCVRHPSSEGPQKPQVAKAPVEGRGCQSLPGLLSIRFTKSRPSQPHSDDFQARLSLAGAWTEEGPVQIGRGS